MKNCLGLKKTQNLTISIIDNIFFLNKEKLSMIYIKNGIKKSQEFFIGKSFIIINNIIYSDASIEEIFLEYFSDHKVTKKGFNGHIVNQYEIGVKRVRAFLKRIDNRERLSERPKLDYQFLYNLQMAEIKYC